jgi:hypothetical protein
MNDAPLRPHHTRLRLYGVVKFNNSPRDRKKILIFLMTLRLHGDHGVVTELPRRCNAFLRRFDWRTSTALYTFSLGALAALTLR